MIESQLTELGVQLDMELCRALFQKDPDKVLELVSEWLEANKLTPSVHFTPPDYLRDILSGNRAYSLN